MARALLFGYKYAFVHIFVRVSACILMYSACRARGNCFRLVRTAHKQIQDIGKGGGQDSR